MIRALIVDDDEVTTAILRGVLEDRDYEVLEADNGAQALEMVQRHRPQIVICDWMMPKMNGLQLCRKIRAMALDSYVYIVMLTSRSEPLDVAQGLSAGADDFMSKPFDPTELAMRLEVGKRILSLETRHVAIFAMAKLAESRDPETGRHLERIRLYCEVLARRLNQMRLFPEAIDEHYIRNLYLTSPLHDIGKVGIPDSVLLKPGRLTDSEFAIMKEHTTIGAHTLAAAAREYSLVGYLQLAHDIALSHHERYDGSGYPHGLKGDTIPLGARIVALADVYDALSSRRVYKEAFTNELTMSMILDARGSHFDPRIVDAFESCAEEFHGIRVEQADKADVDAERPEEPALLS